MTDAWMMEEVLHRHGSTPAAPMKIPQTDDNVLAELENYFSTPIVQWSQYPDPIAWWGVSSRSIFFAHSMLLIIFTA